MKGLSIKKIVLTPFQKDLFKASLIGGILILGCIIGIFIFNGKINAEVDNIIGYKFDIATRAMVLQSVQALEGDYQKIKNDIDLLYSLLPTSDHLIDFSAALKDVAKIYSIDQGLSFTIENLAVGSEPKSYGFTLVIAGTSSNLIKYFTDVEKLKYFIRLEQIDVGQVSGEGTKNSVYRLNILGRVFIR